MWGSACTLLTLWLAAHALAPDAFGRLTFYLALFLVLDALADFGTGQVAVQQTAHDERAIPAVLANARRVRMAMAGMGVLLVGGGAIMLGEHESAWILLASLYPLSHVFELSTTVLKNRIAWEIPVLVRSLGSALSLGFVLLLLHLGEREPARILCAIALGSTIANVLLWLFCRPHRVRGSFERLPLGPFLAVALPLGLAGLCQQAYFYVDNLFVRPICGAEELGRYNVAVRVMSYSIMVAIYATQAAMPWFARRHAEGELGSAVAQLGQPLAVLGALGAGLVWPWSAEILSLFGAGFALAAPALRWLLLASATVYVGAVSMTALVAAGRTRSILFVAVSALATNLVTNAVLVPLRASEGAGIATFVTEASVVLLSLLALSRGGVRGLGGAHAWRWLAGPLAFALAAALSSLLPMAHVAGTV